MQSDHRREYRKEYRKEYCRRSAEIRLKYLCRKKTAHLIDKGKIKKDKCSVCGKRKVEVHHFNYNNPRDIIFLCKKHHLKLHKELKELMLPDDK